MNKGHCTNLPSRCSKAKQHELIPMPGPKTKCPECGLPVKAVKAPSPTRRWLIPGAVIGILLVGVLAWFFFRGPANPTATQNAKNGGVPIACGDAPLLKLTGTQVVGRTLAPELARAWLGSIGATNITTSNRADGTTVFGRLGSNECSIEIRGANSSDGVIALGQGRTDIAMASRQLSRDEAEAMRSLGNMFSPDAEHVIALDALAVIVNPSNPVSQIETGQLADIATGRVAQWNSVGGQSGRINAYVPRSGVRASDMAGELLGALGTSVQRPASDAGVVEAVAADPNGLGLVSFPAPPGARIIAVRAQGAAGFLPGAVSVSTQNYPLTRRLYFYNRPRPTNPNVSRFLAFVQSREGQAIVARVGYGGQNVAVVAVPQLRPDASSGYRNLVSNAQQLNIAFRFRTGGSELDSKSLEDLDRLVSFLGLQSGQRPAVLLIGFADSRGTDAANMQLSRARAEAVGAALRSRGIQPANIRWFGEEQPVGDNSTEAGREGNRRVEVWRIAS